jgi:hypothetical protein
VYGVGSHDLLAPRCRAAVQRGGPIGGAAAPTWRRVRGPAVARPAEGGALHGNRSGSQDLALAILPIHGVPCDHGHASRITTGTVGTAPT